MRPGELRKAERAGFDLDTKEWAYTATKTNTPHIVPLAWQAVEILYPSKKVGDNERPDLMAHVAHMGHDFCACLIVWYPLICSRSATNRKSNESMVSGRERRPVT